MICRSFVPRRRETLARELVELFRRAGLDFPLEMIRGWTPAFQCEARRWAIAEIARDEAPQARDTP